MKKTNSLIWALLFCALNGYAQRIKGTITTLEEQPLEGISVSLVGTSAGALTGGRGEFVLADLPPGAYTLVANGLGYQASKRNVTVAAGETTTLTLQISRSSQELREVTVTARPRRLRDPASATAARLPLANLENPQVVNTVPNRVIVEQAAVDLPAIVRNLPGVSKAWASAATFYSSRGFNTRAYFRNGVASFATADLDPVSTEQLVVVKGPAGTLFGSPLVSFGGLLNRLTKQPFDSTRVALSYQAGSYGLSRFTADVNTPLTKDQRVLLRVTAARHDEGSFQDAGFVRGTFVAPSLLYRATDRLTFSLSAEFYAKKLSSTQQTGPSPPGRPEAARNATRTPVDFGLDYRRSYANNTVAISNPNRSFYGQVDYRISDQWTSQTNLTRSQAENTGDYLSFRLLAGDSLLLRNVTRYPTALVTVTQIQQNFTGDFALGALRNRLVAGLDYYQNDNDFSTNGLNGRGGRPAFDTLALTRATPRLTVLSPATITARLGTLPPTYTAARQTTYGAYASDALNLTDRLVVLLSLRLDRFVSDGTTTTTTSRRTSGAYNQTTLSPKFGLVYELVRGRVSLFGNYLNGFQNVGGTDVNNRNFRPQHGNQLEGGVKAELKRDVLSATVSYYDIRVDNTLRTDAANPGFSVQDGTQFSRGVEADVQARPVAGLAVLAGFAYNESRLTNADASVRGRRPADAGPVRTANLWASYVRPAGALAGLGVGFGGNYVGNNLLLNSTSAGRFVLPAHTLLNAAVYYGRPRYRLAANLDNLTNRQYYTGGFGNYSPGQLRRFIGTLTVRF